MQEPTPPPEPTDEELDTYIHTRYALLGIDISVLPAADEDAPMDQERLLANARSILRQDVKAANFKIDPQTLPQPVPAPFTAWTETRVFFPIVYDGSEWCGSAPRHPCNEAMEHQGGE